MLTTQWTALHAAEGAVLAGDGIPLHYGDLRAEYEAALHRVVLMDRSHEGRLEAWGADAAALLQRISTNDVLNLAPGEGRATVFTNPNGRILDRVTVYNRGDRLLLITEPGRGTAVLHYLQRNIFFNDQVQVADLSGVTYLFALHGPAAPELASALELMPETNSYPWWGRELDLEGTPVYAAARKPLSGGHYALIVSAKSAPQVWRRLRERGAAVGLRPAGSLTYHALRVRAGRPGVGHELTQDYIPLEAGLWDEVSFHKGCYTGQEIIARMESRGKLAKLMVRLELSAMIEAPAALFQDGREVGRLTSSVLAPDGQALGIGFVRTPLAQSEAQFNAGDANATITARVIGLAGAPPPQLAEPSPEAE